MGVAGAARENVEFEELIFPDEIHDFLMWRTWVTGYQATADFFASKLKPRRDYFGGFSS